MWWMIPLDFCLLMESSLIEGGYLEPTLQLHLSLAHEMVISTGVPQKQNQKSGRNRSPPFAICSHTCSACFGFPAVCSHISKAVRVFREPSTAVKYHIALY